MRENRPYGSEGGGTESNRSFLPLSSGSEVQWTCGTVFQAVGVALPPTVQQASSTTPVPDAAPGATPPG
jgi:hypothetical protein